MAVDNPNIVDNISTTDEGIVLTISDHLKWDDENEHLIILQRKINSYLAFVEGGQIYDSYPNAKNLKIKILLAVKFKPNIDALTFIRMTKDYLKSHDYDFDYRKI